MRAPRLARPVVAATVAGLAVSACGGLSEAELVGNFTLEQARAFDDFPLVYAGERVDDLPLTAVLRRDDRADYVSFVYGDCAPASYDVGCVPPVEIQIWPSNLRNRASYDSSVPRPQTLESATVRGHEAAHVGHGQLEIYSDRSTIVIFSRSRGQALAVAAALRCVTEEAPPAQVDALDC